MKSFLSLFFLFLQITRFMTKLRVTRTKCLIFTLYIVFLKTMLIDPLVAQLQHTNNIDVLGVCQRYTMISLLHEAGPKDKTKLRGGHCVYRTSSNTRSHYTFDRKMSQHLFDA